MLFKFNKPEYVVFNVYAFAVILAGILLLAGYSTGNQSLVNASVIIFGIIFFLWLVLMLFVLFFKAGDLVKWVSKRKNRR